MTSAEFATFRAWAIPDYARDNIRAGRWGPDEAAKKSEEEFNQLLPQGTETPNHVLCSLRIDPSGDRVGDVWYAFQKGPSSTTLFVYWIGIDPSHRRKGYAEETFRLMEATARRAGADRIGLNVFGENRTAQALYQKLGFRPMAIFMAKTLETPVT